MARNLELYDDLGAQNKGFLSIARSTHFVVWEKQSRVLRKASLQWIRGSALEGASSGRFTADEAGLIQRAGY